MYDFYHLGKSENSFWGGYTSLQHTRWELTEGVVAFFLPSPGLIIVCGLLLRMTGPFAQIVTVKNNNWKFWKWSLCGSLILRSALYCYCYPLDIAIALTDCQGVIWRRDCAKSKSLLSSSLLSAHPKSDLLLAKAIALFSSDFTVFGSWANK